MTGDQAEMNQLVVVGAGIFDFHRLLNRILRAVGFDTVPTSDSDEIVKIAVARESRNFTLALRPRSSAVADIQPRLKSDDRTAAVPIAAPAGPPPDGDAPTLVEVEPDGYWMRRNGRDISLHPTEYRLLRHLSRHPVRAFLRDELVDTAWWHDI